MTADSGLCCLCRFGGLRSGGTGPRETRREKRGPSYSVVHVLIRHRAKSNGRSSRVGAWGRMNEGGE